MLRLRVLILLTTRTVMWSNGHVLKVTGLDGKEMRILIQDGHLSFVADGVVLSAEFVGQLADVLAQGAAELTQTHDVT